MVIDAKIVQPVISSRYLVTDRILDMSETVGRHVMSNT